MSATGQPYVKPAPGTTLKYGAVGASPATALTPLRAFQNLINSKVKRFATTQIDAVNGDGSPDMNMYKASGKIEWGQLKVRLANEPTVRAAAESLKGIDKQWLMTYADGDTEGGVGAIIEISPSFVDDEESVFDVTIDASGPWTFTPAA